MREQTNYYKILGILKSGEIVMLDCTFSHGDMKGATGSIFLPVTQDEIDERNDIDTVIDAYGYLWQEAIDNGSTTKTQEDFMQDLIDQADGYFFGHDTSYIHHIPDSFRDEYFPDAKTFECVGGGRCIHHGMDWEILLEPELYEEALKFEAKPKAKLRIV